MWDKINKIGIEAIWRDYKLTIKLSSFSLAIVLILLGIYSKKLYYSNISLLDIISISIGITGLILALWSIQSTTISFKEIQADYWNTRGIDEADKKDYHNAYQAYDKAIDIDPQSIKCWINKANAQLEQGRRYHEKSVLINALNTIEEVIERGPKYPATWRKNTLKEIKAKQEYANALKTKCDILLELADVSEKNTYLPPSRIKTAESFLAHFHFMNPPQDCNTLKSPVSMDTLPSSSTLRACAFKVLKEAIKEYPERNPELPGAYVSKGNALLKMGKYDDAISACESAIVFWETIGRDSNGAIAWYAKAHAHFSKGKAFEVDGNHGDASRAYEDAIEACERSIELKPDSAKIWLLKGNVLMVQKKYHEATHAYDKAIEFEPLLSDAWNQRGNVLVEQAKALIHENIGPTWPWSDTGDTISLQRNSYYREALRSYCMSIDINPRDEVFWDNKGNVLTYFGEYDNAIRAHDMAIKLNPQYALARSNKGSTLRYQGKYDEAIRAYDEAIELNHDFAGAYRGRGEALKALGRTSEAEASFARAKELGYSV